MTIICHDLPSTTIKAKGEIEEPDTKRSLPPAGGDNSLTRTWGNERATSDRHKRD